MEFIYIVLLSAAITGGIIYVIYTFAGTRKRRQESDIIKDLDLEIDEDFLEDVDEGFEGMVYKKAEETQASQSIKEYPECFGTIEIYSTCKRDCSVLDECASTIKMLKGF